MNITEALNYAKENHQSLLDSDSKIIGVAHTPDEEAEFYFIEISLNEEDKEEQQLDFLQVIIEGGDYNSSSGVEDYMGNEDINRLISTLPDFCFNIKYRIYKSPNCFGMMSNYALKNLFPELPDPEFYFSDSDADVHKKKAIEIINSINNF